MTEFKINCFFDENAEDFSELFYKSLEDFISEKI